MLAAISSRLSPIRAFPMRQALATVEGVSPFPVFDPVIHEPNRLQICALLVPEHEVGFAAIRDELGLSDSALSKHLKTLAEAGHVEVIKTRSEGHLVTSAALTQRGREALCGHVSELQRLARVVSTRPRASA